MARSRCSEPFLRLALRGDPTWNSATPDHVIRTKRAPLLGRGVDAYAAAYRRYFDEHAPSAREEPSVSEAA